MPDRFDQLLMHDRLSWRELYERFLDGTLDMGSDALITAAEKEDPDLVRKRLEYLLELSNAQDSLSAQLAVDIQRLKDRI